MDRLVGGRLAADALRKLAALDTKVVSSNRPEEVVLGVVVVAEHTVVRREGHRHDVGCMRRSEDDCGRVAVALEAPLQSAVVEMKCEWWRFER